MLQQSCSLWCVPRAEELQRKRAEEERHQQELARVQARVDASDAELKAVSPASVNLVFAIHS